MKKLEELKAELIKQIEAMEKLKKETPDEWLAIEDAVLILLHVARIQIEMLQKSER